MPLVIKTNNQYRETLNWWDLTPKEQKEFDYLLKDDRFEDASFVRYCGNVYDVNEFMRTNGISGQALKNIKGVTNQFEYWDGYHSDTYFSGILIKYDEDCESVKMGRYYS